MILSEIQRFLNLIFDSLDWDIVLFVGLGFQILLTIFFIVKSHFAYEMRVVKKLVKLNGWLSKNHYIDSNNLLEFNDLMKKTPKLLRYHWHQYMLYREKDPSFYMSPYNCIEKPLKTSSFKSNIKNYILMSYGFALFMFVLGVIGLGITDFEFIYLAKAMLIPVFIIILNIIFVMILRARENHNLSALYQYFHYFNRFMDRAVTTMPPYVDFEVLFTASEIRKGIPVLNEYLEKRARQEQEELEKARLYAVEHEVFDFSEAGLNGSLVLDRAMKEAETYLNIRQRLLSEVEQFDGEIDSLKRNYENTQRDYEKKMQASKENVARLRQQQEESTNRIESNYIKKQQSDEIKKQEQLEKDHDSATVRFNQEMEVLLAEINTRKKDLEERRQYVEDAMKAEYQTFSLKMFKSISASLDDKIQQEKDELVGMKDEIVIQLEDAIMQISEKNAEIDELKNILKKHRIKYAGYGNFESRKLQAETKRIRRGKKGLKDEIKDEFDTGQDAFSTSESLTEANVNEEIVYDENGGYYDNEGNYRYKSGAYYDKDGIYHDEKGGWFEADGVTYHPPETDDDAGDEKTVVSAETKIKTDSKDLNTTEDDAGDEKTIISAKTEIQPQTDSKDLSVVDVDASDEESVVSVKTEIQGDLKDSNIEVKEIDKKSDARKERKEKRDAVKERQEKRDETKKQKQEKAKIKADKIKAELEAKAERLRVKKEEKAEKARIKAAKIAAKAEAKAAAKEKRARARTDTKEEATKKNLNTESEIKADIEEFETTTNVVPETTTNVEIEEKTEIEPETKIETETDSGINLFEEFLLETENKNVETVEKSKDEDLTNSLFEDFNIRKDLLKPEKKLKEEKKVKKEEKLLEEQKTKTKDLNKETPTEKKKPGRPRKVVTEDEEPKVKRPRGRPRKIVTEDEEPKVKRPRGRPRKVVTEDEEPKIKRPRGRPRKTESSNELQLLNQQIADENSKLKKQKEEFKSQLDEALSTFTEDEE